jgi:transcriptional regulator with XRE-family HTH domain
MGDTLEATRMNPGDDAGALPMPLDVSMRRTVPLSVSAIEERRGNQSQREIARDAGISQSFLSELESGRKRLTPRTARKLAPVLGTTPDGLMLAEHWTKLKRVARKGGADPYAVLAAAKRLIEMLPEKEDDDAIVAALVGIAREGRKPPI